MIRSMENPVLVEFRVDYCPIASSELLVRYADRELQCIEEGLWKGDATPSQIADARRVLERIVGAFG